MLYEAHNTAYRVRGESRGALRGITQRPLLALTILYPSVWKGINQRPCCTVLISPCCRIGCGCAQEQDILHCVLFSEMSGKKVKQMHHKCDLFVLFLWLVCFPHRRDNVALLAQQQKGWDDLAFWAGSHKIPVDRGVGIVGKGRGEPVC